MLRSVGGIFLPFFCLLLLLPLLTRPTTDSARDRETSDSAQCVEEETSAAAAAASTAATAIATAAPGKRKANRVL